MKRIFISAIIIVLIGSASLTFAQEKTKGEVAAPAAAEQAKPPAPAATPPPKIDTGDTAWMLTSAALVLLMTPGLALFYGGMVRTKNVLGTIMHSFIIIAVITVQWVLWGYSLAFRPRCGRNHRKPILVWAERGRSRPLSRLWGDDPPSGFHDLPVHVCDHYPGLDHRGDCRAHEVQDLRCVSPCFGRLWFTTPSPTGSGGSAAGSATWARWILPAGPWCTSALESQLWLRRSWWGREKVIEPNPWPLIICP